PTQLGWQQVTLADMTPENLAVLDYKHNIGVLLGKASGGLCTIDIDADADVGTFLALNPKLAGTLRTRGARGCNFWMRVNGEFPPLHKITKLNGGGQPEDIGEWRSDGGQTIIWGTHPSGCKYQRLVKAKPVEITFSEIRWPEGWVGQQSNRDAAALEAAHG